jgi:hypothetical protein
MPPIAFKPSSENFLIVNAWPRPGSSREIPLPLRRYQPRESTCFGFASPEYVHLQGFSPSWWFDSSLGLPGLISYQEHPWGSFMQPFRSDSQPKPTFLGMGGLLRNSSPLVWSQLVRLLPPRRIPLLRFQRLHSLKSSAPAGFPRSHHVGKPELSTTSV